MKNKFHIFLALGFACISFKTSKLDDGNLKLYLPDDLKIELWAESPMLYNPTNMDTDSKGRIWVTEGVNYRNFNNDSTTFFHHNEGDRIVILTDTDQDGKADKTQVFVQDKDLVAPLGIAVLGNEILVNSFRINLMFMVFSLLPLPPLDGGRLIASLLPPAWAESYLKVEPYTPMIILLMLFLPSALATLGIHFHPLLAIMMPLLRVLQDVVLFLSGHV